MEIFKSIERPDFRRPERTCDRTGCPDAPVFQMAMDVRPPEPYTGSTRCETALYLCDVHAKEMTLEMLLPDSGWEMILAGMRAAQRMDPDRARTLIVMLPILKL